MSENPRQNESIEPAGEPKEKKVTLEDLGLQSGSEIDYLGKRWKVDSMDADGDISIKRVGEIGEGERDHFWIIGPKSRKDLERKGVTFLSPQESGEQKERTEIELPSLKLTSEEEEALLSLDPREEEKVPQPEAKGEEEPDVLKKLGLKRGQRMEIKGEIFKKGKTAIIRGINDNGELMFDLEGEEETESGAWRLEGSGEEDIKTFFGLSEQADTSEEGGAEIGEVATEVKEPENEEEKETPRQNESIEPAGEPKEKKVTLEDLGLQRGDEIEYYGERFKISRMDAEGDILIERSGEIGEIEKMWIIKPESRENLERLGVKFLSSQESGGEEERMEIRAPSLASFREEEKAYPAGAEAGEVATEVKEPENEEEKETPKPTPMAEGEAKIEQTQEEMPKKEGEKRGMRPEDARKEMMTRQIGKITNLERFKGEMMREEDRKDLEALITELQGDRTDYLIEQWLRENPNEREESSFGQDMPLQKKLELFMARGGKSYLEKNDEWRQLASLAEDIRMSGGQLNYESTLLANFYLNDFQEKTAAELSKNPENAPLHARQDRISRTREALYKQLYKKEIPYNDEEAKRLVLNDPRVAEDYQKFLNELNNDNLLTKKGEHSGQNNVTIAALEAQGYTVKPFVGRKKGLFGFLRNEIPGVQYFKDGVEVHPSYLVFSDARKAFIDKKEEEFIKRYLPEKIRELKMNELRGLTNINGEDFERLAKDQENLVLAKIIEIKERARLKKEDPAEAKRYEEMSKDKGVNVKEGLKGAVEDWDEIGQYDENSFDFDRIFSRFGGAPEGDYAGYITPEDRRSLLKSREKGPFLWMFSIMKLLAKLQKMTEIK